MCYKIIFTDYQNVQLVRLEQNKVTSPIILFIFPIIPNSLSYPLFN
jgi:hypothetical protein